MCVLILVILATLMEAVLAALPLSPALPITQEAVTLAMWSTAKHALPMTDRPAPNVKRTIRYQDVAVV